MPHSAETEGWRCKSPHPSGANNHHVEAGHLHPPAESAFPWLGMRAGSAGVVATWPAPRKGLPCHGRDASQQRSIAEQGPKCLVAEAAWLTA